MVMNVIGFVADQFNVSFNLSLEFRIELISVISQMIMIIFIRIQRSVFL